MSDSWNCWIGTGEVVGVDPNGADTTLTLRTNSRGRIVDLTVLAGAETSKRMSAYNVGDVVLVRGTLEPRYEIYASKIVNYTQRESHNG